jgi:hypothetical protein
MACEVIKQGYSLWCNLLTFWGKGFFITQMKENLTTSDLIPPGSIARSNVSIIYWQKSAEFSDSLSGSHLITNDPLTPQRTMNICRVSNTWLDQP